MKVNVEEISAVKKKIHVEIPEDEVTKEIDSFYEDLKKKAKIKGFRPGKVPREILERYFKDYAKGEVLQKLIQDTYPKALSEIDPLSGFSSCHRPPGIGEWESLSVFCHRRDQTRHQDGGLCRAEP